MSTAINIWKTPTESFIQLISRGLRWKQVIPFFSAHGIVFIYYVMRSHSLFDLSTNKSLIIAITTLLVAGSVYGILSNLLVGYLIRLTGILFKAKSRIKDIYNVMSWAYLPCIFSTVIIVINLLLARVITSSDNTNMNLILSFLVMGLLLFLGIFGIWSLILLVKGLKVAQGLSTINTILNFLMATIIYGTFYYLVIGPYL